MGQKTVIFACLTLVCGLLVGWGGAMLVNRMREPTSDMAGEHAPQPHPLMSDAATVEASGWDVASPEAMTVQMPQSVQTDTTPVIVVGVNGAVRRPGVYTFHRDARVRDGIAAAGGVTDEADMDDINIAARLMDNTSLYIPFAVFRQQEKHTLVARRTQGAGETNPPHYTRSAWVSGHPAGIAVESANPVPVTAPSLSHNTAPSTGLINLNSASLAELEQLPGVGPKTAEKIDAYRRQTPFGSVEELDQIPGIGEKRMEALRPLVTVH